MQTPAPLSRGVVASTEHDTGNRELGTMLIPSSQPCLALNDRSMLCQVLLKSWPQMFTTYFVPHSPQEKDNRSASIQTLNESSLVPASFLLVIPTAR